MDMEEFERLNTLSEKTLNETATPSELKELIILLTIWNTSTEYNLFQGCMPLNQVFR